MNEIIQKKICFIYWGPHEVHKTWAESVNAKFHSFVPFNSKLFKKSGFLLHLTSFLNGFMIPRSDIYILESPIMMTALWSKIIFNKPIIISINSDPFFLTMKKLHKIIKIYFDNSLKLINMMISTTEMMKNIAINYQNTPKSIKHFIVPVYVDVDKYSKITSRSKEENFCFIGPYLNKQKGVDILINFFISLKKRNKLYLIGTLSKDVENLAKNKEDIIVTGVVKNPAEYLKYCKYYFNLSRFEPAGVNIIESMAAGFIPLVSNKCGLAYAVKKINPELVVDIENDNLKEKFEIFKKELYTAENAEKAEKISKGFNKLKSVRIFKQVIQQTLNSFAN